MNLIYNFVTTNSPFTSFYIKKRFMQQWLDFQEKRDNRNVTISQHVYYLWLQHLANFNKYYLYLTKLTKFVVRIKERVE